MLYIREVGIFRCSECLYEWAIVLFTQPIGIVKCSLEVHIRISPNLECYPGTFCLLFSGILLNTYSFHTDLRHYIAEKYAATVFIKETLNHSLNRFIQNQNRCLYLWVSHWVNRLVWTHWFIQEQNTTTVLEAPYDSALTLFATVFIGCAKTNRQYCVWNVSYSVINSFMISSSF